MLKRPDHVTVAVVDLAEARSFFELLGFKVTIEAVISGKVMSDYGRRLVALDLLFECFAYD
jgi:catechol 2,3-dioxygenase-like lactoylglutathione lyase family enzyme